MTFDPRASRLIAVGASVAASCPHCLETNVASATRAGATPKELAEAIAIGRMVREGAARKVDRWAAALNLSVPAPSPEDGDCGCGS